MHAQKGIYLAVDSISAHNQPGQVAHPQPAVIMLVRHHCHAGNDASSQQTAHNALGSSARQI